MTIGRNYKGYPVLLNFSQKGAEVIVNVTEGVWMRTMTVEGLDAHEANTEVVYSAAKAYIDHIVLMRNKVVSR